MPDAAPRGALAPPAPSFPAPSGSRAADTLIVSLHADAPTARRLRDRARAAAGGNIDVDELLASAHPESDWEALRDLGRPLRLLHEAFDASDPEPLGGGTAYVMNPRASDVDWEVGLAVRSLIEPDLERAAGVVCVRMPPREVPRALRALRADPRVARVSVPGERWLCAAPSPARNLQWGLRAINFFDAPAQRATERVRVAVVDSGLDLGHPALAAPAPSLDVGIWDDADPSGHGTHVAGLLCAVADDVTGIAGILDARRSDLAVWRITPQAPGPDGVWRYDSTVYLRALQAVEAMDPPPDVLNLSLAGTEPDDDEQDSIAAIAARGTIIVCASGNAAAPSPDVPMYPARWPETIAVGACMESQRWWPHACIGDHLDIVAPGTNMLSLAPGTPAPPWRADAGAMTMSGTSCAAPLVAGAAARMRARDRSLTPEDIRELLRRHARRLPEMGGATRTPQHGSGCLDLAATLRSVHGASAVQVPRRRRGARA